MESLSGRQSWQRLRWPRKIDPSRNSEAAARGRPVDGRDGPAALRNFADDAGWPPGAAAVVFSGGTGPCSTAAPGHSCCKSKTAPRILPLRSFVAAVSCNWLHPSASSRHWTNACSQWQAAITCLGVMGLLRFCEMGSRNKNPDRANDRGFLLPLGPLPYQSLGKPRR
jgi:hypothetical protein